ncbi:hypothetical protein C0J52_10656 [Blattella germanica]|nr:hypothetical protein C0J52_10656 [Blattella germanica]
MGIQGLIRFLDKATRPVNIRQYSGCCVAIDAYCWLHRGAYTCVEKLARGEPCDEYVYYCMKFVNMLLSHNIKPILVFDGQHLPAKAATEKMRRQNRQKCKKQAAELLRAGRTSEARNFLSRCIDVSHEMALALIKECRRRNVDCIVAPYEADAQLAYLNIKNIAQILVEKERLHLTMGVRPENFVFDKFRYMCILSGCDYLPSLPGIGLVKACKFITRTADPDIHRALSRMAGHLNMSSLTVPDEYRDNFILADETFRYQFVYDPLSRSMVHLTEPPDPDNVTECAGKTLPKDLAFQLALGNLDPFSLKKMDDFNPDAAIQPGRCITTGKGTLAPHASIWSRTYRTTDSQPEPDSRHVERPSTKGKTITNERKIIIAEKRKLKAEEDTADVISDTELMKMYVGSPSPEAKEEKLAIQEPDNKKQRTSTMAFCNMTGDDNSLVSPCKEMESNHSGRTSNSTSVVAGKSPRNPFFKQQPADSKSMDSEKCEARNKLRLGLQRTEIDEKTVNFENSDRNIVSPTSDAEKTNSDIVQASLSKSFSWCKSLKSVKERGITENDRSTAVKQEFKNPLRNTDSLSSHDNTLECNKSQSVVTCSRSPSRHVDSSCELDCESEKCLSNNVQNSFRNLDSLNIQTSSSQNDSISSSSSSLDESCRVVYSSNSFKKPDSQDLSDSENKNTLNSSSHSSCKNNMNSVAFSSSLKLEQDEAIEEVNDLAVKMINNIDHNSSSLLPDSPSMQDGDNMSSGKFDGLNLATSPSTKLQQTKPVHHPLALKTNSCRRLGLSRNAVDKQQSLLSMFGFQRNRSAQMELVILIICYSIVFTMYRTYSGCTFI